MNKSYFKRLFNNDSSLHVVKLENKMCEICTLARIYTEVEQKHFKNLTMSALS